MKERKSYSSIFNLLLLSIILLLSQVMLFVMAPALRYRQELHRSFDIMRQAMSDAQCEIVDEYLSLDLRYVAMCNKNGQPSLVIYDEKGRILASENLRVLNYTEYIQVNFNMTNGHKTTRMFLNDQWVWIVRYSNYEIIYNNEGVEVWKVTLS